MALIHRVLAEVLTKKERKTEMKRMKKTITLMILAGMLTASLASCVVRGDGEGSGEVPTGTEPIYQVTTDATTEPTNPTTPTNDPTQVTYTAVDDIVYVSSTSASVKLVSDVTQTKNLAQLTELHRTGKASNWCKVEYEGQEYYIATKMLTTDDIGEKTFTVPAESKTLYNMGTVNIRKYASSDNGFSTVLTTTGSDAIPVTVVSESALKGWTKVKVTVENKEYEGFMSTKYLTTNPTGEADDYDQHFTALQTKTNMYVSVGQVAVRERPYTDGSEKGLLKKNAEVVVVAKGTVEGMEWCAIEYENAQYETMNYFVAADCLSVVGGSLEQMLAFYEELEQFDSVKTFYVSEEKVHTRSTPAIMEGNTVEFLYKTNAVKAVAMGVFAQEGGSSSMTWCLIEDGNGGYCFISYGVLTSNSDGTPAPAVTDVNFLIEKYDFTKVTGDISKKFKVGDSGLYGEPTTTGSCKKLAAGTVVKVIAEGETTTKYGTTNKWYIVEYQGGYYFALQKVLENA